MAEEQKVGIEILSMEIKGVWNYKVLEDTDGKCSICRNDLMLPTENNIKKELIKPQISVGDCGHIYHTFCIDEYTKKTAHICPVDRTKWVSKTQIN